VARNDAVIYRSLYGVEVVVVRSDGSLGAVEFAKMAPTLIFADQVDDKKPSGALHQIRLLYPRIRRFHFVNSIPYIPPGWEAAIVLWPSFHSSSSFETEFALELRYRRLVT